MKDPFFYKIIRPIVSFLFRFFYRPEYIGLDNINSNGKLLLVGNHTNNLDCLLLISSTKRVLHFLAKDSLNKGFKKVIFKNMGIIPVNRKIHDKNALNSAIVGINDNKAVLIFPEGTINKTDDIIMPFKYGSVKIASVTNCPITPFVISGKYRLFKKSIKLEVLKPIVLTSDDLEKENRMLENIIANKIRENNNEKKN